MLDMYISTESQVSVDTAQIYMLSGLAWHYKRFRLKQIYNIHKAADICHEKKIHFSKFIHWSRTPKNREEGRGIIKVTKIKNVNIWL
jgi:hypothetical protein